MLKKNFKNLFILFLCLLPVITGILYVYLFAADVAFSDQWEVVPLFEKFFSNSLSFKDFYSLHNEHRMVFPRLVMLGIGIVTGYNNIIEMYFIQILFILSLLIISLIINKQFHFGIHEIPLWFILIPFLVLSLRQSENMLFGMQINFLLVLLAALLTFYFIYILGESINKGHQTILFTGAVISATISSFSCIMGLLVWISALLQLIILPLNKREKFSYSIIWAIMGVIEWSIYFIDYHKPGHHPGLLNFLSDPLNFIKFFFISLGTSLFWDINTSFITGIVIIVLIITAIFYLYKYKKIKYNSFWMALLIFSLSVSASITVGRSGMGPGQAIISRYSTFSIPAVISIYVIFIDLLKHQKDRILKILFTITVFMIIASIPYNYSFAFRRGKESKVHRDYIRKVLLTYETQPDSALIELYPVAHIVRERAPALKKAKYNVFRE